jgi:hypothetical protein
LAVAGTGRGFGSEFAFSRIGADPLTRVDSTTTA